MVSCYLMSSLQNTAIEVVHFVSHVVTDHDHGGFHSYSEHSIGHSHSVLVTLDSSSDEDEDDLCVLTSEPIHKVELLGSSDFQNMDITSLVQNLFSYIDSRSSLNKKVLSPPPK